MIRRDSIGVESARPARDRHRDPGIESGRRPGAQCASADWRCVWPAEGKVGPVRRSTPAIAVLVVCIATACTSQQGAVASRSQLPTSSVPPTAAPAVASEEQAHLVQVYGDAHSDEFAGVYF